MIETLSLCPICYKKIPAKIVNTNGIVVMSKKCDVHGPFTSVVEKDIQHVSNFYRMGTQGNNNTIIVHSHNECNMKCEWCYYPMGCEKIQSAKNINNILRMYKGGFNLLLSGGEPTINPYYFEYVKECWANGWPVSTITNMIKLADDDFFAKTQNTDFITNGLFRFAMSMQHPKNYSEDILHKKIKAIENIERSGNKAMCVMFSIQSLDELDYIREFYNHTKHTYTMIRIRTMFQNWNNKDKSNKVFLSDLHKAFIDKFSDLMPTQSNEIEHSNMYCLYMKMSDGMHVSLSSSPTVENVDYHLVSRPVYMLAMDGRCYPVPLAQIINEGISRGWKDGYRLEGVVPCG